MTSGWLRAWGSSVEQAFREHVWRSGSTGRREDLKGSLRLGRHRRPILQAIAKCRRRRFPASSALSRDRTPGRGRGTRASVGSSGMFAGLALDSPVLRLDPRRAEFLRACRPGCGRVARLRGTSPAHGRRRGAYYGPWAHGGHAERAVRAGWDPRRRRPASPPGERSRCGSASRRPRGRGRPRRGRAGREGRSSARPRTWRRREAADRHRVIADGTAGSLARCSSARAEPIGSGLDQPARGFVSSASDLREPLRAHHLASSCP